MTKNQLNHILSNMATDLHLASGTQFLGTLGEQMLLAREPQASSLHEVGSLFGLPVVAESDDTSALVKETLETTGLRVRGMGLNQNPVNYAGTEAKDLFLPHPGDPLKHIKLTLSSRTAPETSARSLCYEATLGSNTIDEAVKFALAQNSPSNPAIAHDNYRLKEKTVGVGEAYCEARDRIIVYVRQRCSATWNADPKLKSQSESHKLFCNFHVTEAARLGIDMEPVRNALLYIAYRDYAFAQFGFDTSSKRDLTIAYHTALKKLGYPDGLIMVARAYGASSEEFMRSQLEPATS